MPRREALGEAPTFEGAGRRVCARGYRRRHDTQQPDALLAHGFAHLALRLVPPTAPSPAAPRRTCRSSPSFRSGHRHPRLWAPPKGPPKGAPDSSSAAWSLMWVAPASMVRELEGLEPVGGEDPDGEAVGGVDDLDGLVDRLVVDHRRNGTEDLLREGRAVQGDGGQHGRPVERTVVGAAGEQRRAGGDGGLNDAALLLQLGLVDDRAQRIRRGGRVTDEEVCGLLGRLCDLLGQLVVRERGGDRWPRKSGPAAGRYPRPGGGSRVDVGIGSTGLGDQPSG